MILCRSAVHGAGEDWAEKVCAEIAHRIGLPHARYDLAQWHSPGGPVYGVRSWSFCTDGGTLIHGNELLAEADLDYSTGVSRFRQSKHTADRVVGALQRHKPKVPLDWSPPVWLERLSTRDQNYAVAAYAAKARSALYRSEGDDKPMGTLDAFLEVARRKRSTGLHWIATLEGIPDSELVILVDRVPPTRITPTSAEFAKKLILANRARLSQAKASLL